METTQSSAVFQHPADGFYQVEPVGEHPNAASGVVQVIDGPALASIVAAFNEQAREANFGGLLVDHEHFKHDLGQESRAYGWIIALEARTDGLYARIRWTRVGEEAVSGGEYRYFSTEYDLGDLMPLDSGADGSRRVRPMKLAGLTLTNAPNNEGGKPITNRALCCGSGVDGRTAQVQFSLLVNRIQREQNLSFDAAWNVARSSAPALFNAISRRPATEAPRAARIVNKAAELPWLKGQLLNRAASRRVARRGGTFQEAWTVVLNRYAPANPAIWKILDCDGGYEALSGYEQIAFDNFPRTGTRHALQGETEFYQLIDRLRVEHPDWQLKSVWDAAKAENPVLFWWFVLNFDGAVEEAADDEAQDGEMKVTPQGGMEISR